ncbi:TSUP family transporter [Solimonas sp. SE-A11]|nr:TSUP family transporter [Solimonas sp. SE-A11]MDM4770152.1 TSUP family transporter [Solimonas sp. SE-A11]
MLETLTLLLTGFAASFFSALAGGGAGLLQFPALVLLGLPFAAAVATHKVAVVALGVGSTARHLREGASTGVSWACARCWVCRA